MKGTLPGIPLKFEPGTNCKLIIQIVQLQIGCTKIFFLWMILVVYGWGSDVLGFVIEKASGQRLDEYL